MSSLTKVLAEEVRKIEETAAVAKIGRAHV